MPKAPPEVMRNKRPIPELLLKDKREGAYLTGLPLIGATPESGVVYGGSVQWYDNGSKGSPLPRRNALSLQHLLACYFRPASPCPTCRNRGNVLRRKYMSGKAPRTMTIVSGTIRHVPRAWITGSS